MRYSDLVRLPDINRLDLELINLSCFEVVTLVLEENFIGLDRQPFGVLAINGEDNAGIGSGGTFIGGVDGNLPSVH